MEKDSKNPIISKKVNVVSVQRLDFKTKDGNDIKGIKVFFTSDPPEEQSKNYLGGLLESSFFSGDVFLSMFDSTLQQKKFPTQATIIFEIVSIQKVPKAVSIEF